MRRKHFPPNGTHRQGAAKTIHKLRGSSRGERFRSAILFLLLAAPLTLPPPTLHASDEAGAEDETTIIVAPGAQVVLQAPEATHRVEAAWDGGLALPVRSALTAPESGQHWLSVVSRDPAGNLSSVRWVRVLVDDTPPEISLDFSTLPAADIAQKEWLPVGAKITARAIDGESGVQGVSLVATSSLTGEPQEDAGETEASITLEKEGTYQIQVEALDGVENRTEPVTATYYLDGVGPYGEVFAEGPHLQLDDLLIVGSGAEVHVKMDDDGSGIVHWMAEMDGEPIEKSDFHSGWSYGRHEAGAMMMDLWEIIRRSPPCLSSSMTGVRRFGGRSRTPSIPAARGASSSLPQSISPSRQRTTQPVSQCSRPHSTSRPGLPRQVT